MCTPWKLCQFTAAFPGSRLCRVQAFSEDGFHLIDGLVDAAACLEKAASHLFSEPTSDMKTVFDRNIYCMHYNLSARTQTLSRLQHQKHTLHVEDILAPRIPLATKLHFMLVCGDQTNSSTLDVCRQNSGISPANDCLYSRVRDVLVGHPNAEILAPLFLGRVGDRLVLHTPVMRKRFSDRKRGCDKFDPVSTGSRTDVTSSHAGGSQSAICPGMRHTAKATRRSYS